MIRFLVPLVTLLAVPLAVSDTHTGSDTLFLNRVLQDVLRPPHSDSTTVTAGLEENLRPATGFKKKRQDLHGRFQKVPDDWDAIEKSLLRIWGILRELISLEYVPIHPIWGVDLCCPFVLRIDPAEMGDPRDLFFLYRQRAGGPRSTGSHCGGG